MLKDFFAGIAIFFSSVLGISDAQTGVLDAPPADLPAVNILAPEVAPATTTDATSITQPIIERTVQQPGAAVTLYRARGARPSRLPCLGPSGNDRCRRGTGSSTDQSGSRGASSASVKATLRAPPPTLTDAARPRVIFCVGSEGNVAQSHQGESPGGRGTGWQRRTFYCLSGRI
jgi:hypothetical protein